MNLQKMEEVKENSNKKPSLNPGEYKSKANTEKRGSSSSLNLLKDSESQINF